MKRAIKRANIFKEQCILHIAWQGEGFDIAAAIRYGEIIRDIER
jgi:hypothetical protein